MNNSETNGRVIATLLKQDIRKVKLLIEFNFYIEDNAHRVAIALSSGGLLTKIIKRSGEFAVEVYQLL